MMKATSTVGSCEGVLALRWLGGCKYPQPSRVSDRERERDQQERIEETSYALQSFIGSHPFTSQLSEVERRYCYIDMVDYAA